MANNNQKFFRFLRIAIMLGSILVAVAIAYATLNQRVKFAQVERAAMKAKGEKTALKAENNEKAIIKIDGRLEYIQKAVDRIEKRLE